MSIRFPKSCKTRAQKSALASHVARRRWEQVHEGLAGEPVRARRVLVAMGMQRVGIDEKHVTVEVVDDGIHRRRVVVEDGRVWNGVYGRKALVKWFNQVLKSAGV